jgi:hypothetical protein
MKSAATATMAFRGVRRTFALVVGSCGAEGTNPDRLAAASPAETLTGNRTRVASFEFGLILTVRPNGGNHGWHFGPYLIPPVIKNDRWYEPLFGAPPPANPARDTNRRNRWKSPVSCSKDHRTVR